MKYFLEGEKVGLKKLTLEEATQKYVDWLNDMEVTKYLVSGSFPSDVEDIREYIKKANGPNTVSFAIYEKSTDRHIGNVKLDKIDWISRKAEFGIMIGDKSCWGKGYGTETTQLILKYAFDILNLEKIDLGLVEENIPAYKTYKKLGFIEEGRRQNEQFIDGSYHDTIIMGITKKRWRAFNTLIGAIIQVRTSSSRLPGKALLPLKGVPSFLRVYERVRKSKILKNIVIATSIDKSDDEIEKICIENNIEVFRGSLNDVLDRYYQTAKHYGFDAIVRITADCPLIDPEVVDECIKTYLDNIEKVEYVSNVDERTFPDGFDVEIFSFKALERAHEEAVDPFDREHVTPFIRRSSIKRTIYQNVDLSDLRLTLDYEKDYNLIKGIYEKIDKDFITTEDIYRFLVENEDKILISHRIQKEEERKKVKKKLINGMKNLLQMWEVNTA